MPTNLQVPLHIRDSLQGGISQYQPAATKVLAEAHVCVMYLLYRQGDQRSLLLAFQ